MRENHDKNKCGQIFPTSQAILCRSWQNPVMTECSGMGSPPRHPFITADDGQMQVNILKQNSLLGSPLEMCAIEYRIVDSLTGHHIHQECRRGKPVRYFSVALIRFLNWQGNRISAVPSTLACLFCGYALRHLLDLDVCPGQIPWFG